MSTARTARQRARDEITAEIMAAARARLTQAGPGELSLRAVARDVGMVSSAVYRYFASRDDLLTALLVTGYDELGVAAEAADAAVTDRADVVGRWLATWRAVRTWAVEHPGDHALLYGSPVPGYAAPQDTIGPATRVVVVLVGIVADAQAAGRLATPPPPRPSVGPSPVADALAFLQERGLAVDDAEEPAIRTIMAWTTGIGTVSFELFGHLVGSVNDPAAYLDAVALRLAADLGLPVDDGA